MKSELMDDVRFYRGEGARWEIDKNTEWKSVKMGLNLKMK